MLAKLFASTLCDLLEQFIAFILQRIVESERKGRSSDDVRCIKREGEGENLRVQSQQLTIAIRKWKEFYYDVLTSTFCHAFNLPSMWLKFMKHLKLWFHEVRRLKPSKKLQSFLQFLIIHGWVDSAIKIDYSIKSSIKSSSNKQTNKKRLIGCQRLLFIVTVRHQAVRRCRLRCGTIITYGGSQ